MSLDHRVSGFLDLHVILFVEIEQVTFLTSAMLEENWQGFLLLLACLTSAQIVELNS